MNQPQVSIITLNYNGLEDTVECLESLKKINYPNYEVTVVDNGSKGNDAQVLEEKFGDYIHLIENDKNYGFTGGTNIGMRYTLDNSNPDYLLLLDNGVNPTYYLIWCHYPRALLSFYKWVRDGLFSSEASD